MIVTDPLETIKPSVRALRAYHLEPVRARVKLNQNESPWDAPVELKQETLRRASERAWSRYPDFVPASLRACLAQFAGWEPDGILVGNGSNELIQALLMVTVGGGGACSSRSRPSPSTGRSRRCWAARSSAHLSQVSSPTT